MSGTSTDVLQSLSIHQDGDKLHVVAACFNEGDTFYARFDMAAASDVGPWDDVTSTAGDKDQLVLEVSVTTREGTDLVVRPSDILSVFQDSTEADMGAPYDRLGFATKADKTTGAWTDRGQIGTTGMTDTHVNGGRCIYASIGDRTHVVFKEDPGTEALHHVSINSSNSVTDNGDIAEIPAVSVSDYAPVRRGVLVIRGGVKKLRFPYRDVNSKLSIVEFDEAASPTFTFEDSVDVNDGNYPGLIGPSVCM